MLSPTQAVQPQHIPVPTPDPNDVEADEDPAPPSPKRGRHAGDASPVPTVIDPVVDADDLKGFFSDSSSAAENDPAAKNEADQDAYPEVYLALKYPRDDKHEKIAQAPQQQKK